MISAPTSVITGVSTALVSMDHWCEGQTAAEGIILLKRKLGLVYATEDMKKRKRSVDIYTLNSHSSVTGHSTGQNKTNFLICL